MKIEPSSRFKRFINSRWIFAAPVWAILAYGDIMGLRKEVWLGLGLHHKTKELTNGINQN